MKIIYAKFFQPVQLTRDKSGATEVATHVQARDYNIVLDGQFIKVQPKNGGLVTLITVFNTCFLRTDASDENILKPDPAPGSKATGKAAVKQD